MAYPPSVHVVDPAQSRPVTERFGGVLEGAARDRVVSFGREGLRARGWHRLSTLRRRYREALEPAGPTTPVVYHQLMGLDLFASDDAGRHRYLWVHEPFVRWGTALGWAARYADAILFDEEGWRAEASGGLRWVPASRLVVCGGGLAALEERLPELEKLAIKRRLGSPARPFGLYGLYRQQVRWFA